MVIDGMDTVLYDILQGIIVKAFFVQFVQLRNITPMTAHKSHRCKPVLALKASNRKIHDIIYLKN
jgi:hypothetical protein